MQIELPDTLPIHTLSTALEGCGLRLDPKTYRDGVYRVRPLGKIIQGGCVMSGCVKTGVTFVDRRLYCAGHALEHLGKAAGV